jgi:Ankyrin repeats (3 copies)
VQNCGADIHATDMYGHTILHHACYQQDLEVFRYLVETCGASVHSTDMDGWTVLHQACWFCNLETVRYLVATCGADIVAVNREDKTALDLARSKGKQDIISYLQKRLEIAKVTVPGPAATTGRQDNDPALAQIDSPALPASDVAASSTQAAVQAVPATDLSGTDTSLSYSQTTGQQDVANGFPSEENPIAEVLEDNRIGGSSDPPGTHIWDASYILQSPLSPNGSRVLEADSFESDRSRMKTAIWGKEGTFSTSESYVKSLLTDEVLGHGFFGTVYRGHDQRLGYSFAIKTINTEILSGGNLVDVQRAKKTFQKEQQVRIRGLNGV